MRSTRPDKIERPLLTLIHERFSKSISEEFNIDAIRGFHNYPPQYSGRHCGTMVESKACYFLVSTDGMNFSTVSGFLSSPWIVYSGERIMISAFN